jgi:hypothetical protein
MSRKAPHAQHASKRSRQRVQLFFRVIGRKAIDVDVGSLVGMRREMGVGVGRGLLISVGSDRKDDGFRCWVKDSAGVWMRKWTRDVDSGDYSWNDDGAWV